jgi:hypothetical protein
MREFLRGGYKDLTETTVVSNHGRPVFTVFPYRTNGDHAVSFDPRTGLISDPVNDERVKTTDPSIR